MGENIRFPPKAALALGIAFNELATNAVKYGALSNATGSILIEWTIETAPDGRRLLLSWKEKGGPLVKPPAQKGFESRVIERGLAHELEGTTHLDYRPRIWKDCYHSVVDLRCIRRIGGNLVERAPVGDF
jgi:two-component sensor histidine kinase